MKTAQDSVYCIPKITINNWLVFTSGPVHSHHWNTRYTTQLETIFEHSPETDPVMVGFLFNLRRENGLSLCSLLSHLFSSLLWCYPHVFFVLKVSSRISFKLLYPPMYFVINLSLHSECFISRMCLESNFCRGVESPDVQNTSYPPTPSFIILLFKFIFHCSNRVSLGLREYGQTGFKQSAEDVT